MEVDAKLRQMIHDLGRLLSETILDSSDGSKVIRRLREEGYCLYLLVGPDEEAPDARRGRLPLAADASDRPAPTAEPAPPGFMIHGQDLAFLRSIGIDPTRSLRRRRKS